jgi:hypothetical protein
MTVKRFAIVLIAGGLIAASVGFFTAFWAAMFAFM